MNNTVLHHKLFIKNMIGHRCKMIIETIFQKANIPYFRVSDGEVLLKRSLSYKEIVKIHEELGKEGLDIMEIRIKIIVEDIKTTVKNYLNNFPGTTNQQFSTYISENLGLDYGYLSILFSSVEGYTIEKYCTDQRIEKVKELLVYDRLSLTEIVQKMQFVSIQSLSGQFKKYTGLPPSHFQNAIKKKF